MPAEHRADPTLLDAVAAQLTRSSAAALDASHELLAHYSDTGDAPTQRAVDTLIDHAADALRALTDSLADSSRELQAAALPATTSHHGEADGSSARSVRRRGHRA
jgi:hypothetical protein